MHERTPHKQVHPPPRRRPSRHTRTTRSRALPLGDSRGHRWPRHRPRRWVRRRRRETAARTRGSPSARRAAWGRRPGTRGVGYRNAWDSGREQSSAAFLQNYGHMVFSLPPNIPCFGLRSRNKLEHQPVEGRRSYASETASARLPRIQRSKLASLEAARMTAPRVRGKLSRLGENTLSSSLPEVRWFTQDRPGSPGRGLHARVLLSHGVRPLTLS